MLLTNPTQIEITSETTIRDIFRASLTVDDTNQSRWVPAWNRVEGGLGSVVFTDAEIDEVEEFGETADELGQAMQDVTRALLLRCDRFAFGIDAAPRGTHLGIRIRLTHAPGEPAHTSADEIRGLIEFAKHELREKLGKPVSGGSEDVPGLKSLELVHRAIQHVTISTEEFDDDSADVSISAAIPVDQIVGLYAKRQLRYLQTKRPEESESIPR